MKEDSVRKRGWVKNVAIIFLAVLLVLTFFSQHIMNRALPEVAAQYTTSGTITARIRGSGTVAAIQSYEVKTTQTRTVNEVRVRLGDEVEAGDVLIVLAGMGSEELDKAREDLHGLEVELERMLLEGDGDSALVNLRRAVQLARDALATAQRERNAIPFDANVLYAARNALSNANDTLQSLRADELRAEANVNAALAAVPVDEFGNPDPDHPDFNQATENVENARAALLNIQVSIQNTEAAAASATATIQEQEGFQASVPLADERVRDAQRSLDFANEDLSIAQRDDPLAAIKIREQERAIEQKREEVERLEAEGTGSEMTSPVSGVVAAVSISPGNQTVPDSPLMVIEVVDRGYVLSFPVTTEQSTRVRVGDNAEVDRGWWGWGEEIRAILTAVRNDPQNPVTSRLLEFTIHGDIEGGTQLNVTLNQRSENYDTIVPTAAIRSDANGDFVLVVESRSSPLGNRFIATRTDVRILAADDTHTAISGAFSGWGGDFVITHSNEPITPGMQVRLAANP